MAPPDGTPTSSPAAASPTPSARPAAGPRRTLPPLYPALLAAYAPLSLAGANVGRGVALDDLGGPLALSAVFLALGLVSARIVTPDRHRRALVAATIVAALSFAGLLVPAMQGAGDVALEVAMRWTAAVAAGAVLASVLYARRTRRSLASATRSMNVMTGLLLGFVAAGAARAGLRGPAAEGAPGTTRRAAPAPASAASLPDVYYIVLDSYSSGGELAAQYGHDNREFEAALRQRGFAVPARARANYVMTYLALAASLNWTYLHHLARRPGRESQDRTVPHRMIERSQAAEFLQARGYRLVFLPTSYGATARNRNADTVIARRGASEFQAVWFSGTALPSMGQVLCGDAGICRTSQLPFAPEGAEAFRWKLARIAALPQMAGPKLVIAHLMIPHEPFVFRSDCTTREPYWPRSSAEDARWRAAYAEQVACVNRLLLPLVDTLIAGSRVPPVVILQGDHGHGRFPLGRAPELSRVSREQVDDRAHVFAAYHLPGVPPGAVSDSISPVNVWPLVLTHVFSRPTPLLPDETYWSSWTRPYAFTRLP